MLLWETQRYSYGEFIASGEYNEAIINKIEQFINSTFNNTLYKRNKHIINELINEFF